MKGRHPQEGVGWWAERSCCFFHVSWRRPLKSRPSFPPRQPWALTFASLAAQCSCFCRAVENWHFPIEKVSICLQLQHEGVQGSGVQGPLWLHKLEFNFSYLRPCITSSLSPEFFQFPRWPDYSLTLWVALMFPRRHWKCLKIIIHDAFFNLCSAERPVSNGLIC